MSYLPPLLPGLEAALRDVQSADPAARARAVRSLGLKASTPELRAAVRSLLDDDVAAVRAAAVESAGLLRDEEAFAVLADRVHDDHALVAEEAVIAIARIGGSNAAETLREALGDERPFIRFQAVSALAEVSPDAAADAVPPLLEDADAEVRANAVAALATTADIERLARLLNDPELGPRRSAALALAQRGDRRGAATLIAALETDTAFDAAEALGDLGWSGAVEPLAQTTRRWFISAHIRAAAASALMQLGDSRGEKPLRRILRGFQGDARDYVVARVGQLRLGTLADELVRLAAHPARLDRDNLGVALANLQDLHPDAGHALALLEGVSGEATTDPTQVA